MGGQGWVPRGFGSKLNPFYFCKTILDAMVYAISMRALKRLLPLQNYFCNKVALDILFRSRDI